MVKTENNINSGGGIKYISTEPGQCKFPMWGNAKDFTPSSLVYGEPTGKQKC